jgi:hypothetical protein
VKNTVIKKKSSKGRQNFCLQETLTCPVFNILWMAILGGWVPDQLPSRRLFVFVTVTETQI